MKKAVSHQPTHFLIFLTYLNQTEGYVCIASSLGLTLFNVIVILLLSVEVLIPMIEFTIACVQFNTYLTLFISMYSFFFSSVKHS